MNPTWIRLKKEKKYGCECEGILGHAWGTTIENCRIAIIWTLSFPAFWSSHHHAPIGLIFNVCYSLSKFLPCYVVLIPIFIRNGWGLLPLKILFGNAMLNKIHYFHQFIALVMGDVWIVNQIVISLMLQHLYASYILYTLFKHFHQIGKLH